MLRISQQSLIRIQRVNLTGYNIVRKTTDTILPLQAHSKRKQEMRHSTNTRLDVRTNELHVSTLNRVA